MKITAAVAPAKNQAFEMQEVELDAPKDNEVLIKIVATGVCHTDVAGQEGLTTPFEAVFGHEGAGMLNRWAPPFHPLNRVTTSSSPFPTVVSAATA